MLKNLLTPEQETDEKINFVRSINQYNIQHIGFLDTKTTIIIGINGVILTLLFSSDSSIVRQDPPYLFWPIPILLGASAIFGLITIIPQLKTKKYANSLIFSETVTKDFPERDSYKRKVKSMNIGEILDQEIDNAHRLAHALHHQFKFIVWSERFLIVAFGLLVLLLLIQNFFTD